MTVAPGIERAALRARGWMATSARPLELAVATRLGVRDLPNAEAWVQEAHLPEGQLPDGSWDGSVGGTARALLGLAALRSGPGLEGGVGTALMWLRRRRLGGGAWPRCEGGLHERGLCPHWAGGFFAPGSGDGDPPQYRSIGGGVLEGRPARLALSALALSAEVEWMKPAGRDARLHADALRRLLSERESWTVQGLEPGRALVPAVGALARMGPGDGVVWHALVLAIRAQRSDGSWPDADSFEMVELLLDAARLGYGSPGLDAALVRAAGLLVMTQQDHGGWARGVEGPTRFGWSMDAVATAGLEYALRVSAAPDALH